MLTGPPPKFHETRDILDSNLTIILAKTRPACDLPVALRPTMPNQRRKRHRRQRNHQHDKRPAGQMDGWAAAGGPLSALDGNAYGAGARGAKVTSASSPPPTSAPLSTIPIPMSWMT